MNFLMATFKKQNLYLDSDETFYLLRLRLYTRRRHKKLFKHSKITNTTNHKNATCYCQQSVTFHNFIL
jgi:hypothetical protein